MVAGIIFPVVLARAGKVPGRWRKHNSRVAGEGEGEAEGQKIAT
jgi:hypothetical protein